MRYKRITMESSLQTSIHVNKRGLRLVVVVKPQ